MAHKKPIGRKASDEAMTHAQALIDMCEPALKDPTAPYCINPDDPIDDQILISSTQATGMLLNAVRNLAETGWMQETRVDVGRFVIRERFESIKKRPEIGSIKAAIAALSEEYPRSERDLQRILSNDNR